jgi:protein O-mannosyl-transferase
VAVAIAGATIVAYSPALKAPFQFDDVLSIPENSTIRRLWPPSVPLHPPSGTGVAVSGRPVVNYSLAVNFALNERLGIAQAPFSDGPDETVGYHLVNILIHLASGALLFGIVRRTMRSGRIAENWAASADFVASVVTCIWLLHPIQTEAVDYLIQRTELMVSAFYLATLYASIRAWDAGTPRATFGWYGAGLLSCLLGMGSKEVMISAPLIVVLYDRAFKMSSWREVLNAQRERRWFYLGLAVASAPLIWSLTTAARGATVGFHLGLSWYQYFYSQAWAIPHYLWLLVWPQGLTFDYGQDAITGWRGVPGLILLTVFAGATIVAWTRANRWGWFGFLGAWFFLILAPSSSLVPIRTEIAAERRIYLALAAVLVLLVIGADALRRRVASNSDSPPAWAGLLERRWGWVLAVIAAVLLIATFQRSRVYAKPEMLWRDVVVKAPQNPRGYDNLAAVLLEENPPREAEAEALLRRAIALDSTYLPAWTNLATVVAQREHVTEAEQLLEHVLRISPGFVLATRRLGMLLAATGQDARAIPYLEREAAEFPTEESLLALASAYVATGRLDDATAAFRRVLQLDPQRTDVIRDLGGVLVEQGRGAAAVQYLEDAVQREPGSGFGLALLSLAYAQAGRSDDAAAAAEAGAERAAGDAAVFVYAGRAMLDARRPKDAEAYLTEAVRLNPSSPEALTRLSESKLALGNRPEATRLLRRALELNPRYPPALRALKSLER